MATVAVVVMLMPASTFTIIVMMLVAAAAVVVAVVQPLGRSLQRHRHVLVEYLLDDVLFFRNHKGQLAALFHHAGNEDLLLAGRRILHFQQHNIFLARIGNHCP